MLQVHDSSNTGRKSKSRRAYTSFLDDSDTREMVSAQDLRTTLDLDSEIARLANAARQDYAV